MHVFTEVFFLFLVYDKINNVEVWERFLSSGIGKGVNYQAGLESFRRVRGQAASLVGHQTRHRRAVVARPCLATL